jgi:hypothetical protein
MATEKTKILVCGRRWGKTERAVMDDVTCFLSIPKWMSMWVAPSRDQVTIAYHYAKEILNQIPDIQQAIQFKEHPHPEIRLLDRTLLFRTAGEDGRYIKGYGKNLRRITLDEAAYIKKEVVEQVIEPMRLDMKAELIIQGTPFGKNWFYDRFQAETEDTAKFQFPSHTNPHIDHTMLEQSKNLLGEDSLEFKTEYLAEFVDTQGAVFPWELLESCLIDATLGEEFGAYYAGIDIGRYQDYTVCIVLGYDRGYVQVVDIDRFTGLDWNEQKRRIYDIVHKYNATGCADATGEGDQFVEDLQTGEWVEDTEYGGRVKQRPGLALKKVRITANHIKRDLIDKVLLKMHQGLLKIPNVADNNIRELINELKYFRYEMTESGNVKMEAASGKHDDCVMALALACASVYGFYESVQPPQSYGYDTWGYWIEQEERKQRARSALVVRIY